MMRLLQQKQSLLDADTLRAMFHYDPDTGVFTRRISHGRLPAGGRAGCRKKYGYRQIRINGVDFPEHRLAWLHVHGEWPAGEIDHINRKRDDNRLANLRVATRSQNSINRPPQPWNKHRGVARTKWGWQAQIICQGKNHYIGKFSTPEEAVAAWEAKAVELFGEFGRQ